MADQHDVLLLIPDEGTTRGVAARCSGIILTGTGLIARAPMEQQLLNREALRQRPLTLKDLGL